jgi:carbonic anhydrase/acetyltransferase-like protein (isoleucine patch superfamily)
VTHTGLPTHIGAEVMIGHRCILHACTIEDRSFVGMGAVIMDEAVIETGGMLAAGALLAPGKRVKSGELWGGVPARLLRELRPEEVATWPERVGHYVELAADYRKTR